MVSRFNFEHFRAFLRPTTVEVRPITLLFGHNNSGKSALLRGGASLLKSLQGPPGDPWTHDASLTRNASFAEMTSTPLSGKTAFFKCGLSCTGLGLREAAWTLRFDGRQVFVSDCELTADDGKKIIARVDGDGGPNKNFARPFEIGTQEKGVKGSLIFEGLSPRADAKADGLIKEFVDLGQRLPKSNQLVQWLSASRCAPPRQHKPQQNWAVPLQPDGSGSLDFLVAESERAKLGAVGQSVSAWFEKHLKRKLKLEASTADRYDLKIETFGELASDVQRASICLADAGEGLSQVLPILVALGRANDGSSHSPRLICVEEPESHLHPRLHAALAEALIDAVKGENPPQIIAETHSENLLLRLQLAVAKKEIPSEKIGVYWVRQDDFGESRADLVELDPRGRRSGPWPPMTFAEDLRMSRELLALERGNEAESESATYEGSTA